MRGANLEHFGYGLSLWQTAEDGERYRTAHGPATIFIPGYASIAKVPLRSSGDESSTLTVNVKLHGVLVGRWRPLMRGYTATHHLSANHQVEISGDDATTTSYCQCIHRFDDDPGNVWELGGWYRCTLRRDADGRWRITRVRLESVWEHGSPLRPDLQNV